jgi:DNA end-binding protein Ku
LCRSARNDGREGELERLYQIWRSPVAVALYTAASSSERIAFNTLNRATGNRVRREFVDSETGAPVERDKQVKGYEVENGDYVVLEPEEVASAVPGSDKTLKIEAFVPFIEIDDVYFDKPYYLMPDKMGADAFKLLRDGMRQAKVAALARNVLFRRLRTVLIRPHGNGLIGTTLNFDYEVRSSEEAFENLPDKDRRRDARSRQAHQYEEGLV